MGDLTVIRNGSVYYTKDTCMYKVLIDGKYTGHYSTLREAQIAAAGHHWLDGQTPDPEKYFGFVYLIEDKLTGRKYVGCRQYRYFKYPCNTSNNMDRPEYNPECWVDTDWGSYTGSSKVLAPVIRKRYNDFTFSILEQCRSKLELQQAEIDEMLVRGVLDAKLPDGSPMYYNQHIGGAEYSNWTPSTKIRHGLSYHEMYHTWKINKDIMCEDWKADPQPFLEAVTVPPKGFYLCRIDDTRPLSPGNWMHRAVSVDIEVDSATGFIGVHKLPGGKFRSTVSCNGKLVVIGNYPTAIEAAIARDRFVQENALSHNLQVIK